LEFTELTIIVLTIEQPIENLTRGANRPDTTPFLTKKYRD
jgi:hypothetical protein